MSNWYYLDKTPRGAKKDNPNLSLPGVELNFLGRWTHSLASTWHALVRREAVLVTREDDIKFSREVSFEFVDAIKWLRMWHIGWTIYESSDETSCLLYASNFFTDRMTVSSSRCRAPLPFRVSCVQGCVLDHSLQWYAWLLLSSSFDKSATQQ
jgi:hypothetical protein